MARAAGPFVQPLQGWRASAGALPRVRCATLGYGLQRLRRKEPSAQRIIFARCQPTARIGDPASELTAKGALDEGVEEGVGLRPSLLFLAVQSLHRGHFLDESPLQFDGRQRDR